VSELFRLCRGLVDIHNVRDWCQACGVAPRVLSGSLSNVPDLAANDATALLINVTTAVGQFQRDLQNELAPKGSPITGLSVAQAKSVGGLAEPAGEVVVQVLLIVADPGDVAVGA
jgi:hypothetical protein